METKDIIGKEIECFEFKSQNLLSYSNQHKQLFGQKAIVLNINESFPQFALIEITLPIGKKESHHYPTAGIIEQLETKELENLTIEEILNTMKMLTSKI
jgi:hypothetical protein